MKSFLFAASLPVWSCQHGSVPEGCSVPLYAGAKGNICKSGGTAGEPAAQRAKSLYWQRLQPYGELLFSFLVF